MSIVLYGYPLSANSHKLTLLLSLMRLPHTTVPIDLARGEHKSPEFLLRSPTGTIPLLVDNERSIFDSHAAMVYLCQRYQGDSWLPPGIENLAMVSQWLYYEATEIFNGIGYARNHVSFKLKTDLDAAQFRGHRALHVLNTRLARQPWLALDQATIADVCCYPLVAVAEEAGISLESYPNVRDWIRRLEIIPDFIPMPRFARDPAKRPVR